MPRSGLSWGERWSIFLKRKDKKRKRQEDIVKKNAQGIFPNSMEKEVSYVAYFSISSEKIMFYTESWNQKVAL